MLAISRKPTKLKKEKIKPKPLEITRECLIYLFQQQKKNKQQSQLADLSV
jgi:hypothetical protein